MRKPIRTVRRPIFFGCDGESERGYARFLGTLINPRYWFDTDVCGGGDPLATINGALAMLRKESRQGVRFAAKVVLLDAEAHSSDLRQRADATATKHGLRLLWQETCHEALLLRHIDGCQARRPPTSALAMAQLKSHWPDYAKGQSAAALARRFGLADVRRALQVESVLRDWINELKLLDL